MSKSKHGNLRAARSSRAGVMAVCGHADTNPAQDVAAKLLPPHTDQQAPQGRAEVLYLLRLTHNEFLSVKAAVSRDREQLRKAIRKGKAVIEDLEAGNGLWDKLTEIMRACIKRSRGCQP